MCVVGVEDRPDLLHRPRRPVVEIGARVCDVGELWNDDQRRAISLLAGAHIRELLISVFRSAVTVCALIPLRDRIAELIDLALKDCLAAFLCWGEFSGGQTITIRSQGKRHDERHQVGKLRAAVALRTIEKLFGAWAALR